MLTADSPDQNLLLAALHAADAQRLAAYLEPVAMPLGQILYEPGVHLQHAYFPTTAIVSLHYVTRVGASAETASVGPEGMVGVSLFLGGNTTSSSAVVQTAGRGYRLERHGLQQEFVRAGSLRPLLLRYTEALMTQIALTVACNRHHSIDRQLCRLLLTTLDRVPTGKLILTQDLISSILGVRRESITEAAGKLQRAGIIHYRRGHITVSKRAGLESGACECYAVVAKELKRLMPRQSDSDRGPFAAHAPFEQTVAQ